MYVSIYKPMTLFVRNGNKKHMYIFNFNGLF